MKWYAMVVTAATLSVVPVVNAQESAKKTLPTLLIKGEVVSVDTADPAATLLKVKDRYGFETPIYLTQETNISQDDQPLEVEKLTSGTAVEVEYNFDINTAKRHAVRVGVTPPATGAGAAAPTATPAATPETPPTPTASAPPTTPTTSAIPGSAPSPQAPAEAPETTQPSAAGSATTVPAGGTAAKEHPGKEHAGQTTQ